MYNVHVHVHALHVHVHALHVHVHVWVCHWLHHTLQVAMVTPKGDDDFCKLCQYLNGELKAFVDESGSEVHVKTGVQ